MTNVPHTQSFAPYRAAMITGEPVAVGNVYCIGRNYAEHAKELGNAVPKQPLVFLKTTAALRPLAAGPLAFADETFHHEAEVVVLMGRDVMLGASASEDDVAALALGLDLTRRDVQSQLKAQGLPWTTAKSFAGAAPLGPFVPRERFGALSDITFALEVNGEARQHGHTHDMLFPIPTLLTYIASFSPLRAGDVVFTGTPPGVGPLRRGDRVLLSFTQLGLAFDGSL